MANTLARFKKYTDKLDEVYQHASVTAVLDGDGSLVQMGANAGEMIIPKSAWMGWQITPAAAVMWQAM